MNPISFVFFLAFRNVLRYRKRTLQSFLVLLLGAFCIMLVDAYMKGYAASASERIVALYGHLDVHAKGYLDSAEAMPLDLAIPEIASFGDRLLGTVTAAVSPGVRPLAAATIESGCMLSNGESSRAALVLAADPRARSLPGEARVGNPLLSEVEAALVSGRFFTDGEDHGTILDERHANRLGLHVGDALILLGSDAFGSFSLMESPVIGVAREATLPEGAGAVVDLASFSRAFGLEDQATCLSLWLSSRKDGRLLDSRAEGAALQAGLDALAREPGLEARPFAAISASYITMFEFLDVFLAGMMAIFAVVAAAGMTNAILLSVHDRVKDLGTLRAIALTSRQAGLLLYAETAIIGLAAALGALLLGFAVVACLVSSSFGIRFEMAELGSALPSSIRPRLYPLRLLTMAAISALFPLLAAILPSRTLRRLTIRESLGY
ncbi:MAG TPA: FtsX-like permease family protein [Rectinemataceae bacterium]|nr:FtsX-like permease family protein [Rectinemataceae bacterium]